MSRPVDLVTEDILKINIKTESCRRQSVSPRTWEFYLEDIDETLERIGE